MKFTESPLPGAFVIDLQRIEDERGFFARTFCAAELAARGLAASLSQCSVSFNRLRGTLRGLHYQAPPCEEEKLVRCTAGAIFDVIVDLRRDSPTHRRWFAAELTAENHRVMYVPRGVAHGFMTLSDATEVFYMMSEPHAPDCSRGVRWDDPAFAIRWPILPTVVSARDAGYVLLDRSAPA